MSYLHIIPQLLSEGLSFFSLKLSFSLSFSQNWLSSLSHLNQWTLSYVKILSVVLFLLNDFDLIAALNLLKDFDSILQSI